jgi:hypothetical protein
MMRSSRNRRRRAREERRAQFEELVKQVLRDYIERERAAGRDPLKNILKKPEGETGGEEPPVK